MPGEDRCPRNSISESLLCRCPKRITRRHKIFPCTGAYAAIHSFPKETHEKWTHILVPKSCEETKNPHFLWKLTSSRTMAGWFVVSCPLLQL